MRTFSEGDKLTTADGTIWLVEAFNGPDFDDVSDPDFDPAYFLVDLIKSNGPGDQQATSLQLDNIDFEHFCKAEGIVLP